MRVLAPGFANAGAEDAVSSNAGPEDAGPSNAELAVQVPKMRSWLCSCNAVLLQCCPPAMRSSSNAPSWH